MTNTRAATRQTAAGVPAPGRYRIDRARSSVTFRTRHLFGLGVVSGTMAITHGEMTIDPGAARPRRQRSSARHRSALATATGTGMSAPPSSWTPGNTRTSPSGARPSATTSAAGPWRAT